MLVGGRRKKQQRLGERFRSFLDSLPYGIIAISEDGAIHDANTQTEALFGYTVDELIGMPVDMLVPERWRAAHAAHRAEFFAHGRTRRMGPGAELVGLRKDGTELPVEITISPLETPAGRLVTVVVSDITERCRIELALRASEERYRDLLEHARDVVYTHDLEGKITYVNAAGRRLFGFTEGEALGLNILDMVDPSYETLARTALDRVLQEGELIAPFELLTRAKDGAAVWVEVNARVLRDEHGAPVAVNGIARDVTARRNAEEALLESEDRYRQIFDGQSAIRLLIDPETRTIVEPNRAACEYYGYTREQLIGMDIANINTLPAEEISAEMATAAAERRTFFSFKHRLRSGEVRDVEVYSGPVDIGGRRLLFSIIHDITERKRVESLLISQRQILEMVAVGAPLGEVLESLTLRVEANLPGALCSILLVDADGTHLRHAAAPSLPDAYNAAVDGVPVGPNAGSCGTAAFRRAPVVVSDIAADALWDDYRDLALGHGLRSCWSTPIFATNGSVLGTFAVYYQEPHVPAEADLEVIEMATHLTGIAIERERVEAAERNRAAELERLYKRLVRANSALEDSKQRLEEKSFLLERALDAERERARRDPLTGTLNHAAITDLLRSAIADPATTSLAIAMVDVDGLKAANDTYGHQTGDAVLVRVANTLRNDDAIVGRYGGDEFVAVLVGADRARAERYRDEVTDALGAADLHDPETGTLIKVVASVGLAIFPEEADAVEDLIKLSDSAMYASRRQRAAVNGQGGGMRTLGGDRAAKMIGEIVPFLTSPGNLADKLSLVASRVSLGAGYDAVNFSLFGIDPGGAAVSNSFADAPSDLLDAWDADPRQPGAPHPMRLLLERTHRTVIIDDIAGSDLVTDAQRELLTAAGIRSALIAPMMWQGNVVGALSVGSKRVIAFGPRDAQFVGAVATQVTSIVRTAALVDELQAASSRLLQAHTETVMMLASAAEAHDHTTGLHLQRVRGLALALAQEMGYDEEMAKEIGLAAVLHDIGKIRVPDYVLASSATLSDSEWALMKRHTAWGSEFLGARPGFELAALVARSHHERWDGSGYPDGLAGEQIPEAAAITSVADGLDAMTNDRPYRTGQPLADAIMEIRAWSGRQFSPRVVEALVRLYERGALPFVQGDEAGGHEHAHAA